MNVNMLTIQKKFSWPSVQSIIDGNVGSFNGMSMKGAYGWRRWEKWCVAFDMEVGQIFTYVDGDEDGATKTNADTNFKNPLESANHKIKEKDMITDVLVGCYLTDDSVGK